MFSTVEGVSTEGDILSTLGENLEYFGGRDIMINSGLQKGWNSLTFPDKD